MFGSAVIVFREVVEAALVVSIVMAAARAAPGRNGWVGIGIGVGVAGASLVAGFAASIAGFAAGIGQELLNAAILFVAVAMLACHNVWMARHGRELAARVNAVGHAVASGARPLYALAIVIAAAVLREGSETVLFVYGIAIGGGDGLGTLIAGCVIGLASGIALGATLYFGLLRIPMGRLFAVTNGLILLLAAGMAAQGAGFLVQAEVLPTWGYAVWDTSAVLSEHSVIGKIMHALIGYVAEPMGIQLVFYITTLLGIGALMQLLGGRERRRSTLATIVTVIGLGASIATQARADFKVRSPIVEYRELEIEHNGNIGKSQGFNLELEYGLFEWWKPGLELEAEAPIGENLRYSATTFENYFQLTPQGKYWADLGVFAEISKSAHGSVPPYSLTIGPLVRKEVPDVSGVDTLHMLNVLFSKDIGHQSAGAPGMRVAWQSRIISLTPLFQPGVEYYWDIADVARPGKLADQQHRVGPVVASWVLLSSLDIPAPGGIKSEIGYLRGITPATEKSTYRWRVELEFPF